MSKSKLFNDLNLIQKSFGGKKPSVINWKKIDNMSNAELEALHKILK